MINYSGTVIDQTGKAIQGASVAFVVYGTNNNANLFASDGATPVDNPVITDSNGRYSAYMVSGLYDLYFTGPGMAPFSLAKQDISDNSSNAGSPFVISSFGVGWTLGTSGSSCAPQIIRQNDIISIMGYVKPGSGSGGVVFTIAAPYLPLQPAVIVGFDLTTLLACVFTIDTQGNLFYQGTTGTVLGHELVFLGNYWAKQHQ